MGTDVITISKKEAMEGFFDSYLEIEGYLGDSKPEDLKDYLASDIFISCAAGATGINPEEFVEFGLTYLPSRMSS
ncbi:hypothetical protein [Pseudodesulfovibrio karagichevae]|uniref:Uncharacterized protein n=1 Tax=Pseudodesulfovibrio karagichevae TaxID=3239305 RepID=A0ABV4K5F8_9BACT